LRSDDQRFSGAVSWPRPESGDEPSEKPLVGVTPVPTEEGGREDPEGLPFGGGVPYGVCAPGAPEIGGDMTPVAGFGDEPKFKAWGVLLSLV